MRLTSRIRIVLFAFFAVGIAYFLRENGLDHSALFYIGIPLMTSLVLVSLPGSSVTGTSVKVVTLAMLLSVPLLKEGVICLIFAAPIIILVTMIIACAFSTAKNRFQVHGLTVIFILCSIEGVTPGLSFNRDYEVEVSRLLNTSEFCLLEQLQQRPEFSSQSSWPLAIFPKPVAKQVSGLALGDRRSVGFTYNKLGWFAPNYGELSFMISQKSEQMIRYSLESDTSYLTSYMTWGDSDLSWEPEGQQIRFTILIRFKRKLDPAWYFGPLERFVVLHAARYWLDQVVMPAEACSQAKQA